MVTSASAVGTVNWLQARYNDLVYISQTDADYDVKGNTWIRCHLTVNPCWCRHPQEPWHLSTWSWICRSVFRSKWGKHQPITGASDDIQDEGDVIPNLFLCGLGFEVMVRLARLSKKVEKQARSCETGCTTRADAHHWQRVVSQTLNQHLPQLR